MAAFVYQSIAGTGVKSLLRNTAATFAEDSLSLFCPPDRTVDPEPRTAHSRGVCVCVCAESGGCFH